MYPFNLESALLGQEVVTRDGRKILEIQEVSASDLAVYPVIKARPDGNIKGAWVSYTLAGIYNPIKESELDLFMKFPAVDSEGNPLYTCAPFDLAKARAGHPLVAPDCLARLGVSSVELLEVELEGNCSPLVCLFTSSDGTLQKILTYTLEGRRASALEGQLYMYIPDEPVVKPAWLPDLETFYQDFNLTEVIKGQAEARKEFLELCKHIVLLETLKD